MKRKWKQGEAIVFAPKWCKNTKDYDVNIINHPLKYNELVYYLCEIPNVPGHCIVVRYNGQSVPMVHPDDFRKAKESEL